MKFILKENGLIKKKRGGGGKEDVCVTALARILLILTELAWK